MYEEHDLYDPYEEYRERRNGCRDTILVITMALVFLFIVLLSSCKTYEPIEIVRDSVRVEFRHDSVYVFKHDSIFRDRWRNGDTVFVTVEKFRTLYKDKIKEVHDTIRTNEVQTIETKVVPAYYKNTSAGFWVLLVLLLAVIAWRIYKLYIKIKTGGLIR